VLEDKSSLLNKDFLFFSRKKQYLTRKNILSLINPESSEFEKSFRAFTDLNESSR
jgi:hypothetical protein